MKFKEKNLQFGTKAETLFNLRSMVRKSTILDLSYFTVEEWLKRQSGVLKDLMSQFGNSKVIVRSSSIHEDRLQNSGAGLHVSVSCVDPSNEEALRQAVETVIASYDGAPANQVLVQPMLTDTQLSGVVMTRNLNDGAPYYTINYDDESGKTDRITGGTGVHKTVFISSVSPESFIESERLLKTIHMAKELEELSGKIPLDIEFAISQSGKIYLFQARRISVSSTWRTDIASAVIDRLPVLESFIEKICGAKKDMVGNRSMMGIMPDWNPAEIIGTTPQLLAISLYRLLITKDVWRESRELMGYKKLPPEELMVTIAGRPYIDIRNSFNSFLPHGLDNGTATKLVNAWLNRLDENCELHDKIEFEIAQTCLDFTFDENHSEWYGSLLTSSALRHYRDLLQGITRKAVDLSASGSLGQALASINELSARQEKRQVLFENRSGYHESLSKAKSLLEECKILGTLPFAIIARHAFIAESLLRSLVKKGAITKKRLAEFKRSVRTVSSDFAYEFYAVCMGEMDKNKFIAKYGHLRPGTYDIKSLRYSDRNDIFTEFWAPPKNKTQRDFKLSSKEKEGITQLTKKIFSDDMNADSLFEYARKTIQGREYAKFCFTRNLSDAIEWLAKWGDGLGLSREDVANLGIDEIYNSFTKPSAANSKNYFLELVKKNREEHQIVRAMKLGFLIKEVKDLYVVPIHRNMPNFVGEEHQHGPVILIDAESTSEKPLHNHIVLIENADPGFDWIFGRGIKGLITKYGGANSHMAIRCSEFGLPAAIGCGEQMFTRIATAGAVDLNCKEKIIKPVYEH